MSAHSYGRSSATSHGHPLVAPRGSAGPAEGQLYDSSTTTTSQSEAEGAGRARQRRGPEGIGGAGTSSFASSHYNDVYGEDSAGSQTPSSMDSRTPNARDGIVQNYFSEQPSGRNLLHVLPQGTTHDSGGGGGQPGSGPQASPGLGTYQEAPSGRGLVNDQSSSEYDDGGSGHGGGHDHGHGRGRGGGTEMSSPSQSEGSSAWNDTDAQSVPASYGQDGGAAAAAAASAAAAAGRHPAASGAFITEARSAFTTEDTKASDDMGPEGASSPVVREVELYEDDLAVSEGSAAASRLGYGSEMTYGHDTAAGSSMRSLDGAQGARGGAAGQQRLGLGQAYGSSGSSVASRVIRVGSEMDSNRMMIPGQESWRNSPQAGDIPGEIDRILSGETTDSSVLDQRQGQEDGDFGTVWLANRAHARQYDATQDRG